MDRPGPRKGHAEPVPYLGGLAIFAGAAVSISVFQPAEWDILALLGLVALIGLVDDVRYLPVWIKLIGEVAIAASAVALGFSWNVTDSPELNGGLAFPLALAIFDTSLVIASRLATGRPIQLGGQDHFSHRLRLLGWSPYQILAAAVAGSFTGAACASLALSFPNPQAWLALPLGVIFVAAWAGLLRVDQYVVGAHPQVEGVREQRRI